ncbi:MAG: hypothetical protein ACJ788_04740 [Ktedonobacteraceae bacterium]
MVKDYIVFIHGVYTRGNPRTISYADRLFQSVQKIVEGKNASLTLIKVPLYWGDLNEAEEEKLKKAYASSPDWSKFWFRRFRETALLQFAGDAALYISPYIGAKIIARIYEQIREGLKQFQPDDRVHLVAHSFGAIILFDMLFASRWDEPDVPGYEHVLRIREFMYGLDPEPRDGFSLASIHTLGAPIGLFSLMDVTPDEEEEKKASHNISPRLRRLLRRIREERAGYNVSWLNFAHPADPLAHPLKPLITEIVGRENRYVDIQDITDVGTNWLDILTSPFRHTLLALVNVGNAHGSYWYSLKVAEKIADAILKSAETA